ncbi:MAG: EamA family transporter [Dechloromonas sp.]|nr:EamA family transporter [Dechloromonas sp.]
MVLVTLLWSIAGVVTRHLDSARSFEVTFWRSFFTALSLAAGLLAWRGRGLWTSLRDGGRWLWLSGLCWAVMFTAFMLALTLTSVAYVLVTMALGPVITALFSRIFLRFTLPWSTWLAIVVAGLGVAVMFGGESGDAFTLAGVLVACCVPLAGAANWTVLQRVRQQRQVDMLPAVLIGAIVSALITLPLAWPLQASGHDLGLLALLGAVQLALPCLLVVRLSRHLPAAEISLLALLEVVFGVAWAWLWAAEQLSPNVLVGGGMILLALVAKETAGLRKS